MDKESHVGCRRGTVSSVAREQSSTYAPLKLPDVKYSSLRSAGPSSAAPLSDASLSAYVLQVPTKIVRDLLHMVHYNKYTLLEPTMILSRQPAPWSLIDSRRGRRKSLRSPHVHLPPQAAANPFHVHHTQRRLYLGQLPSCLGFQACHSHFHPSPYPISHFRRIFSGGFSHSYSNAH